MRVVNVAPEVFRRDPVTHAARSVCWGIAPPGALWYPVGMLLDQLANALRHPKSTMRGIFITIALLSIALSDELSAPGFDLPLWVTVVSAVGGFIMEAVSTDAPKPPAPPPA